jgi:ribulose-phosphate 3-epimerase
VQAFVSLWSADLLALGDAVDAVADHADGFHIDVFDGHDVPELLFGPDLVAAVRDRTDKPLDIHLNVTDPDYWAGRFIAVGADMVTVQRAASPDIRASLDRIRDQGAAASLGLETREDPSSAVELYDRIDRVLVMGTELGVKGQELDEYAPDRVRALVAARTAPHHPAVFVDGGIRPHTVDALAEAGADGVIPGSLVYGDPDPVDAIHRLHRLPGVPWQPCTAGTGAIR